MLRPHRKPVDELVLTVLSQNTNDRNRDVAYGRLRERFSSWAEVRDAPVEEVEKRLVRSRSLIVIDWNANREVHSAIRDVMDRQKF